MQDILIQGFSAEWARLVELAPRLTVALVVFILFILVGRLVAHAVVRVLDRGQFTVTHKGFFRSLTRWVFVILGLVFATGTLGLEGVAAGLAAGGGITAVVLGFAFREIGENFLAGFFLAFNCPFRVGDLIRSGEMEGHVRTIDLRHTHIRTVDGRDIYVPNGQIYNQPLINYTRDGLRRVGFDFGIDYRDDSRRARTMVLEILGQTKGVLETPPPTAFVGGLENAWVTISVGLWIDTVDGQHGLAEIKTEVMERVRAALLEADFTFSSEVSTAIDLSTPRPARVEMVPA